MPIPRKLILAVLLVLATAYPDKDIMPTVPVPAFLPRDTPKASIPPSTPAIYPLATPTDRCTTFS